MRIREIAQVWGYWSAMGTTAALSLVACSKGDTVTPSDSGLGTEVTTCGSLDPAEAAQITAERLEHLGTVGLAALSGLENSRAAARLLSFGDGHVIEPFVAEAQADLHDSLVELRDKQLLAANVESVDGSVVTFLLHPETLCEKDPSIAPSTGIVAATGGSAGIGGGQAALGGSAGATGALDPECVKDETEHPKRIRVSRIACDSGDNVAVEVLYGPEKQRLILAELFAERANLELDLGAYLRAVETTSESVGSTDGTSDGTTVVQSTREPLVSAASGTLRASVTLSGADRASGKLTVAQAIDVTLADESAARLRLAAGTDLLTVTADGTTKGIQVVANVGAFDWRSRFQDFIADWFGLETSTAGNAQEPVDLHVAGVRGTLTLDGAKDVIVAEGMDLGAAPATATQGARVLLTVNATDAQRGAIAATITGKSDDDVGLALPKGLWVNIRYGLEPVMTLLQSPANYLAKDELALSCPADTQLTLFSEVTEDNLAVTASQTGALLSVNAGALMLTSSLWPSDTVSVPAGQCMTRAPATSTARHDLLDDFLVGACAP